MNMSVEINNSFLALYIVCFCSTGQLKAQLHMHAEHAFESASIFIFV